VSPTVVDVDLNWTPGHPGESAGPPKRFLCQGFGDENERKGRRTRVHLSRERR